MPQAASEEEMPSNPHELVPLWNRYVEREDGKENDKQMVQRPPDVVSETLIKTQTDWLAAWCSISSQRNAFHSLRISSPFAILPLAVPNPSGIDTLGVPLVRDDDVADRPVANEGAG